MFYFWRCIVALSLDVARPFCIIAFVFCLIKGGDVHALLCATGTRGVAVDPKVFQQRHGGVLGTRIAGGSGVTLIDVIRFCAWLRALTV